MKQKRPITTLFMLVSVDGKISTGAVDIRDVDKDYKKIVGVREGVYQYYDLEKTTDINSLNSGKVMAKIGVNSDNSPIKCPGVNFIIIDNNHLTAKGITNLTDNLKKLYLVTKNPNHPAFEAERENLEIIKYDEEIDFVDLFDQLKEKYEMERITIQSGGLLNSVFLRLGLIDNLSLVFAPVLVGGDKTPSLIDGESIVDEIGLKDLKALKLESVDILDDSYIHLVYKVNNNTIINV